MSPKTFAQADFGENASEKFLNLYFRVALMTASITSAGIDTTS
jgi:hypothetical protein